MAQTSQPHFLSSLINAFTGFDEANGFAVNLFVVAALAVIGGIFLSGRRRLVRPALIAFTVLCLGHLGADRGPGFPRRSGHRP